MRRLLIRPGGIGDCVVSLPALECLRSSYTEVWTASRNVPLIRFADRVRSISSTGLDLLEIQGPEAPPGLLETLAGFDSIISWYGSNREQFRTIAGQLGLPFQFLRALPPNRPGTKPASEGGVAIETEEPSPAPTHAVDFYLAQAGQISERRVDPVPRIRCPARPGDYIVIHPFSGSARKNWPLGRYRLLAAELERHAPVQWCAGPAEHLPGARRFQDLYELGCWLAGARLHIGNDSGITHLAAAVGSPLIALFGPTDPGRWAPRGEATRVVKTQRPGQSMDGIPVEVVSRAARRMLAVSP